MPTVLRPMSTAEVLDRTFFLYRNHFVLFFGISLLPPALQLLMEAANYAVTRSGSNVSSRGGFLVFGSAMVAFVLGLIAWFIGYAVAQAATVFAVSAVHLERPTTIRESYGRVRGRYGRMVNLVLSMAIRIFGPAFAIILLSITLMARLMPTGTLGAAIGALLMLGGFIAAIVLFIWLFLRYAVAVPACVLEDIRARAALKRSVALTRGSRGRIFVVVLLFGVLEIVISGGLGMLIGILGVTGKLGPVAMVIATNASSFIVGALLGPVIAIALALVYYDERVRKEAFDIQLMMAALDGTPPAPATTVPAAGNIG